MKLHFIYCVCMCACVRVCVHVCVCVCSVCVHSHVYECGVCDMHIRGHLSLQASRGQSTVCRSGFSSPTLWVLGVDLRSFAWQWVSPLTDPPCQPVSDLMITCVKRHECTQHSQSPQQWSLQCLLSVWFVPPIVSVGKGRLLL